MHEPTFRACVADVGVNPYLLEMVNLREHCSWVHLHDRRGATEKAKDMVKVGVARARHLQPQIEKTVPVTKAALVIGGGVAGIQAALDLADSGIQVYLVEKEPSIGGIMAALDKTYPTMDCSTEDDGCRSASQSKAFRLQRSGRGFRLRGQLSGEGPKESSLRKGERL
jgi:heterodisulfide reductase subunit A